ncbi:hypothetical protein CSUI_007112, partial [Cystoisospora suis]
VTNDDEDHVTGFTIFIEEFALLLLEHGYRLMPYHITAHADALNAKSEDEGDDDAAVTDDTILEHSSTSSSAANSI